MTTEVLIDISDSLRIGILTSAGGNLPCGNGPPRFSAEVAAVMNNRHFEVAL